MKYQNDREQYKKEFIQRLIKFSINIFSLCKGKQSDYLLKSILDQLIRSSSSIGANVVEAQASSSRRDYIKFFDIALKSANETKYWLLVLDEVAQDIKIGDLLDEVEQISKIIAASLITLKGKR